MYRTQSSRQRAYGLQDCMVDYLEVQFDSEEKPERFCGEQEGKDSNIVICTIWCF